MYNSKVGRSIVSDVSPVRVFWGRAVAQAAAAAIVAQVRQTVLLGAWWPSYTACQQGIYCNHYLRYTHAATYCIVTRGSCHVLGTLPKKRAFAACPVYLSLLLACAHFLVLGQNRIEVGIGHFRSAFGHCMRVCCRNKRLHCRKEGLLQRLHGLAIQGQR